MAETVEEPDQALIDPEFEIYFGVRPEEEGEVASTISFVSGTQYETVAPEGYVLLAVGVG